MGKEFKLFAFILLFIIFIGFTYYLYVNSYILYAIVVGIISFIILLSVVSLFFQKISEEDDYELCLKKILRTYDAIVVQTNPFPNLRGKDIIRVFGMNDLIDAQAEMKKPIYYMKQQDSTAFLLMGANEALIYILKRREDVVSPIENLIKEAEKFPHKTGEDEDLLSDIDKTTIVKLSNKKVYKVSPVRKKKKETESLEEKQDEIELLI